MSTHKRWAALAACFAIGFGVTACGLFDDLGGASPPSAPSVESAPKAETNSSQAESQTTMISKDDLPEIADPENTLVIKLKDGLVVIALNHEGAPNHAERLKTLAREGFYDGIVFHRVIDGFMAQTGDPTGTGRGGSELPDLAAEFGDIPFGRGVVGMARSASPNSANSQFFITFQPSEWLNGQYTVVGTVVSGMEHVDKIKRGVGQGGSVPEPQDKMLAMKVAADI